MGVFNLLDEQARVPKSSDESACLALNEHLQKASGYELVTRGGNQAFAFRHYAGKITYTMKVRAPSSYCHYCHRRHCLCHCGCRRMCVC